MTSRDNNTSSEILPDDALSADEIDMPADRRRIAHVVHDERGDARVEWQHAPLDYDRDRPQLAIVNEGTGDPFNPYNREAEPRRAAAPKTTQKRDLRRLSEWIKMMRGLEEKRARGESEEDDDA